MTPTLRRIYELLAAKQGEPVYWRHPDYKVLPGYEHILFGIYRASADYSEIRQDGVTTLSLEPYVTFYIYRPKLGWCDSDNCYDGFEWRALDYCPLRFWTRTLPDNCAIFFMSKYPHLNCKCDLDISSIDFTPIDEGYKPDA